MRIAPSVLLEEPVAKGDMIPKNGDLGWGLLDMFASDGKRDFRE